MVPLHPEDRGPDRWRGSFRSCPRDRPGLCRASQQKRACLVVRVGRWMLGLGRIPMISPRTMSRCNPGLQRCYRSSSGPGAAQLVCYVRPRGAGGPRYLKVKALLSPCPPAYLTHAPRLPSFSLLHPYLWPSRSGPVSPEISCRASICQVARPARVAPRSLTAAGPGECFQPLVSATCSSQLLSWFLSAVCSFDIFYIALPSPPAPTPFLVSLLAGVLRFSS